MIRDLNMASAFRQSPKGCIHHTDRSSQYCSHDYQKILRQSGIDLARYLGNAAASRVGKLRDGCLIETLFGTSRNARKTLEEWQEAYNWHRPH